MRQDCFYYFNFTKNDSNFLSWFQAGMLKEALAALERIGEKKKINECLEMIRSLGQNITLH